MSQTISQSINHLKHTLYSCICNEGIRGS